jgi:hypothetical protein
MCVQAKQDYLHSLLSEWMKLPERPQINPANPSIPSEAGLLRHGADPNIMVSEDSEMPHAQPRPDEQESGQPSI